MGEETLTVKEASDRLRVNLRTIYRMIDRGELPAARAGRAIRIKKADIDRLFSTRQTEESTDQDK